jgi:SanA protein
MQIPLQSQLMAVRRTGTRPQTIRLTGDRPRRLSDRTRRIGFAIVATIALAAGLLAAWTAWTLSGRYAQQIYGPQDLDSVPPRRVALVFGAGYWSDGSLSDILRDRLDAAIELFRAGRVEILLFSGDNRVVEYNEPAKMEEYARLQGVPEQAIVLDFAGRRTYDSCYRARQIFLLDEVVLVTQRYHAPRAIATCRGLGLAAIAYTADRTPYVHIVGYWLREVPALWKTMWDMTIAHPRPVLGEPLPILD